MSIYVTGDCHGDWQRFSTRFFPQQKEMTRNDYMIVCGDFGLWHDTAEERYWLDWLEEKNFILCFVDGNHENFDRLYSDEFAEVDFCGGKAHKIRENIYHLERGYVYTICDKKIFAFGGASSHDIDDGILDRNDYKTKSEFNRVYRQYQSERKMFRVNHVSWWKEELPSNEEMARGIENLEKVGWDVDFVITHCSPQTIASIISNGFFKSDSLTLYFNGLLDKKLKFKHWFFGHYHGEKSVMGKFHLLYYSMKQIA